MAESSAQEKTELPTPKRLEDARKKGQVARSRELNTLTSLLGAGFGMLLFGPAVMQALEQMLKGFLGFDYASMLDHKDIDGLFGTAAINMLMALLPLLLLLTILALCSPLALGGWTFSGESLQPKFERINPLQGFARIFSHRSLEELGKALAKFILVAAVIIFTLYRVVGDISLLSLFEVKLAISKAGSLLVWCFIAFSAALILVVILDVPYQLWSHRQQLMMSKQEIKDESKESEGRPEVKAAIRAKQQEIAQRRMMDDVKKADVIITNPTHYAVALRYDHNAGGAPKLVGKGKDLIAAKIRELAAEHGIAVFAAPPLARALYFTTALNQEIPEKLFVAVAQVLAYIYQLRNAAQSRGMVPPAPQNLPVPAEYDSYGKH